MGQLSESAKKQVALTFESNPEAESYFVTSDGQCFIDENEAINHGARLTHELVTGGDGELRKQFDHEKDATREVFTLNRSEFAKKKAVKTQEEIDAEKAAKEAAKPAAKKTAAKSTTKSAGGNK